MPRNKKRTVYALTDPRTGAVRYVGISVDVQNRLRHHVYRCTHPHGNSALQKWLSELGALNLTPKAIILDEHVAERYWEPAEKHWIAELAEAGCALTNATPGGWGKGRKRTAEERATLRAAFAKRSPEYFEKNTAILRERAKRPVSAETRKKQSEARKRRVTKPETRMKMSAARKNKPWTEKRRAAEIPGRLSGVNNPGAKLTLAQVEQIRALHTSSEKTLKDIGMRFGTSESCVWRIVHGKSYR